MLIKSTYLVLFKGASGKKQLRNRREEENGHKELAGQSHRAVFLKLEGAACGLAELGGLRLHS